MTAPPNREEAIFNEAIALPATGRSAYLDQACAGDTALRARVAALLQAHDEGGSLFDAIPGDLVRTSLTAPLPDEQPGALIDRYKLLQKIGEGGCGVVYMAEQEEPVHRKVALKVIKLGMDTKEVIARFEAERQALALMEHPNIARVLDGGATATGRPYFVMELVRGMPITAYCDEQSLSTPARLGLFMQVCQAVQHAHQKGIIHRDLKPSNILVTVNDGDAVPKVIDFGIAKATQGRLTDRTLFTAFEQFIGTPAYMSPEQAELTSLDVDTRSDIYSLGVLLYELLTGQTPFDAKSLLQSGLDEIRRIIREVEPPRPSARLSTLTDADRATVAKLRGTAPLQLSTLLRGDLDWIVMRCLEKDRRRRYETANGLAMDLQRHLHHEPVVARPPSTAYRFRKFVARNRLGVTAASAVLATLVIGLCVSTWAFLREKSARERAVAAERQQGQLRNQAEQLQATAEGQAAQIRRQLYASHMNVAFQAWDKGEIPRVEQLLTEHAPKPGEEDLRGFEWFYLWRLSHSEQLTLSGHHELLRCVTFSPDGRLLATGGDDSTARIWDAATGRQLHLLSNQTDGVNSVAFSPDGKTLATAGGDKTVRLCDVVTGREFTVLGGHNFGVTAIAFSPDGRWLVAATGRLANGGDRNPNDKFVDPTDLPAEIKIWNVEARKVITTLTGHTKSILSLAVSPDGQKLATGSADSTVRIWNIASKTMEASLTGFSGPVMAVAFSPDGQTLASGGGNLWSKGSDLKLWDTVSLKERMVLAGHHGPVFALAFSPEGQTLASGGMDGIVRFWNTTTGTEVRTIRGHQASVWSVAYEPTGKRIATASWDQAVKVWDAVLPQGPEVLQDVGVANASFSPDSRFLIVSSQELQIVEPGTGKVPFTIPGYYNRDITSTVISPDGSILASGGWDSIVTLWETRTWRKLASLKGHGGIEWWKRMVRCLVFSPDGRVLASGGGDETVRLWDVDQRRERAVFHPDIGTVGSLLFTPDGRTLIAGGRQKIVFLDGVTGGRQASLDGAAQTLALTPDGRTLAAGHSGVELIDLKTMEAKWLIKPERESVIWSACFSPDGRTLSTASWDGTARLWNVASGQEMFTYRAPGVIWSAAFSPDGKWWAVGCDNVDKAGEYRSEMAIFRGDTVAPPAAVVAAPRFAPTISVQPISQTVNDAQPGSVTFGVFATGTPPLAYQWRKGGQFLPGETNSTLTIANATAANAGNYSVVVSNALGRVASREAALDILHWQETPIAEINFQDKQPSAGYSAFTYSEYPVTLLSKIMETAGAGAGGATGLVMTADGSGFKAHMEQGYAGFGAHVTVQTKSADGVNTTDLKLYKLYATVRTTGQIGTDAHGRIQWQFLTPNGVVLTVSLPCTLTSSDQTYSYILSDGQIDETSGGSWRKFIDNFDQIDRVQCSVDASNWLGEYGPDADNALYISKVKFVRLVPESSTGSASAAKPVITKP